MAKRSRCTSGAYRGNGPIIFAPHLLCHGRVLDGCTHATEENMMEAILPRASVDDVYALIVKDALEQSQAARRGGTTRASLR